MLPRDIMTKRFSLSHADAGSENKVRSRCPRSITSLSFDLSTLKKGTFDFSSFKWPARSHGGFKATIQSNWFKWITFHILIAQCPTSVMCRFSAGIWKQAFRAGKTNTTGWQVAVNKRRALFRVQSKMECDRQAVCLFWIFFLMHKLEPPNLLVCNMNRLTSSKKCPFCNSSPSE